MKIDTHCHLMLRPFCGRPATDPEKLLADLAECGLDGGWVSSIDAMVCSELSEQKKLHDELADLTVKYAGKLWGMCVVNPNAMDAAVSEVDRCVRELGFIAVKVHPWLQAISVVRSEGLDLIMAHAGQLRVPVLFHDGSPPYSTPLQIAYVAERHSGTTVVLGHSGLADLWRDAAEAAKRCQNILLQPTAAPSVAIRAAFQAVGSDRMLFGTDAGFGSQAIIRYGLDQFRDALGQEIAERIISENPAKLLARI